MGSKHPHGGYLGLLISPLALPIRGVHRMTVPGPAAQLRAVSGCQVREESRARGPGGTPRTARTSVKPGLPWGSSLALTSITYQMGSSPGTMAGRPAFQKNERVCF